MSNINNNLEKLHGWYITYNSLSNVWMAAQKEHINDITNNFNSPNVIKANSLETIQGVIIKKLYK
jgi:hypothetical protein